MTYVPRHAERPKVNCIKQDAPVHAALQRDEHGSADQLVGSHGYGKCTGETEQINIAVVSERNYRVTRVQLAQLSRTMYIRRRYERYS